MSSRCRVAIGFFLHLPIQFPFAVADALLSAKTLRAGRLIHHLPAPPPSRRSLEPARLWRGAFPVVVPIRVSALPLLPMPCIVTEERWEMSQKSWEALVSAFILEASEGLRALGRSPGGGEPVKTQIARAARQSGLSYWRAFDLWYRKARSVQAAEIEAIRTARATRSRERSHELASLASDFEALAERVSRLAAGSGRADADALRALSRRTRNLAEGE